MIDFLLDDLNLLPAFLGYWLVSVSLVGVFAWLYTHATPYREISLIRQGNVAAAWSLGGALLGYVAALAFVIAHSVETHELVFWGILAGAVQIGAYRLVRFILPNLAEGIEQGRETYGLFLGLVSTGLGLLTGACMVP